MQKKRMKKNAGQIAVEYVLILFISITLATIAVKSLISRDENEPGSLINAWNRILGVIGNDLADCPGQSDFSKPDCR